MQLMQQTKAGSVVTTCSANQHTPLQVLVLLSEQYNGILPASVPDHYVRWARSKHRSARRKWMLTSPAIHTLPHTIILLGMS